MAHRIRKAMTDVDGERMMTGIVEVDEVYIGGKAIRRFRKEMCT